MTDVAQPGTPHALAEPTRRVSGAFLGLMALANLGIMAAFFAPIQNLLPRMSEEVAGADGKEVALAIVLGVGVVGSVIGNPLAGAFSDRTTSRFGRRRPWLLGGSLLGLVAFFVLPSMSTVVGLTLVWLFIQFSVNAAYAALTAAIPDQVPVPQRGVASGWVSMGQAIGPVFGVGIVAFIVLDLTVGTYVIGVLFVLLMAPFVLILKDPRLDPADRPPFAWRKFLAGFWVSPRQYPDFAWAWLARFLVQLGISVAIVYLLFYLKDYLRFGAEEAGQRQTILLLLYAGGTVLTAVIGGYFSDRSGKRRKFVVQSTIVIAAAALLLSFTSDFKFTMLAALVLGLGSGWYFAVDLALITQVLPGAVDRARDLGVINIANSLPQVLAPVIAAVIVTSLGGYPVLYLVTGVIALLGAAAVLPIKSVP